MKLTTKERIHSNAMYAIGVEIIEKGFCRLMKPQAQYVANEIKRIHDYNVDVSSPFVLKRSASA
jgi:hypothetical protein